MMLSSSMARSGVPEPDRNASPSTLRAARGQQNSSKTAFRPPEEKRETKKTVGSQREESGGRIKQLEGELRKVKDSEMKMLESLMSQTKQLAETKIELEEAKLEIGLLQDTIRSGRNLPKGSQNVDPSSQQEIARLRNELKLATGAEDKSKKAMDDLAAALKEVASEASQAKEKLLVVQTQLLDKRSEVENTRTALRDAEEKLGKVLEEVQSSKMEAEDSAVRWNTKQEGLKACLRLLEDEIKLGKEENAKLIDAQKTWKNELSNMRDIMKHALNEATMAKQALEEAVAAAPVEQAKISAQKTEMEDPDKVAKYPSHLTGIGRSPTGLKHGSWIKNGDIRSESVRYPPSYSQRTRSDKRFGSFSGQRGPFLRPNMKETESKNGLNMNSPTDDSPRSKAKQKKKHMFRKFADILRRRSISTK